jgi:YbbR domain-containing protein
VRSIKKKLLESWGLKVTAICLAFMLWYAVRGDPRSERSISVPLEIHNIPRNLEITSERPTSVDITIRGSIANPGFGQVTPACVIDLQSAGEGERNIPIGPSNVRLSRTSGLEVVSVRPPRIRLMLERTTSKEIPISPALIGRPAEGFEVYSAIPFPPTTVVTGPRSRIDRLKEINTEAISIQGLTERMRTFVNLNIQDGMVQSSTPRPVEVNVDIGIRRRLVILNQIPVLSDDSSVIVDPSRIALHLLVPITFKRTLTSADFTARVFVRSLDRSLPLNVKPGINPIAPLDPAIRIKEVVPSVVTVRRSGKS